MSVQAHGHVLGGREDPEAEEMDVERVNVEIQRHSGEGVNEPADVNMQEDESHSHSDDDEMEPESDDDNMGPPPLNMNMPPRPKLRPPIGANLFPHFPSRDHILADHDPNIMDPPLENFLGPPLWGAGTYLRERDTSWEGRNRLFWKMPNSLGSREVCVCVCVCCVMVKKHKEGK